MQNYLKNLSKEELLVLAIICCRNESKNEETLEEIEKLVDLNELKEIPSLLDAVTSLDQMRALERRGLDICSNFRSLLDFGVPKSERNHFLLCLAEG